MGYKQCQVEQWQTSGEEHYHQQGEVARSLVSWILAVDGEVIAEVGNRIDLLAVEGLEEDRCASIMRIAANETKQKGILHGFSMVVAAGW